jgi:hypothetical protein
MGLGAIVPFDRLPAGVRQARLLFNREGIHVGAEQEARPFAVTQHSGDTMAANPFRDLKGQLAQGLGYNGCRVGLMPREFRILVQAGVDIMERLEIGSELFKNRVVG